MEVELKLIIIIVSTFYHLNNNKNRILININKNFKNNQQQLDQFNYYKLKMLEQINTMIYILKKFKIHKIN